MPQIILASASPRRSQLLTDANISHLVIPSTLPEVGTQRAPANLVIELARQKANEVFSNHVEEYPVKDCIVIGADTVVSANHKILGKPKDYNEAFQMLKDLQGKTHQVYTGVCLIKYIEEVKRLTTFYECSHVSLHPISDEEIHQYIETGEPFDKAGGYGIQGSFKEFVLKVKGDYENIVGLPVKRLQQELIR